LDWFGSLNIRQEIDFESGLPITVIYGEIADQPALYGLLARVRDLNLTLMAVNKVIEKGETSNENK
jgi:hypothetical protein